MKDACAAIPRGMHRSAPAVSGAVPRRSLSALVLALPLVIIAGQAAALPSKIILLSQTSRGFTAEGRSEAPAVNANGIFTAYASDALNLVAPPFTNTLNQVYARNVEIILSGLVSESSAGTPGNKASQNSGFPPGISADGHVIVFSSLANNLVPGDTNNLEDVFVVDTKLNTIELVSQGIDGPGDGPSTFPKISADGRFIVYQSLATNILGLDNHGVPDIFVYDREQNATILVSLNRDGEPPNGASITPDISEDGRVVAYASRATDLVDEPTNGAFEQIYVIDLDQQLTQLVSVSTAGRAGNGISFLPDLSRNGSQVAFKSEAFNLVPNDTNGVPDVFVRDRTNSTTQRVSVDSFGNQSNSLSGGPGISGDGRFVAFASFASNLVPEDGNGQSDVFVYDRFPPNRPQGQIAIVTVGFNGQPPNNGVSDFPVTMSSDGRWIGFASAASNLVPNDLNNDVDAFLACNPFDAFACAPPTATPGATPTKTPDPQSCAGDCNGDGAVMIDDLIRMVNIALALAPLCPDDVNGGCLAGDATCDCEITVDDIVRAVQNSLQGCHDFVQCGDAEHEQMCCEAPAASPTATPPSGP